MAAEPTATPAGTDWNALARDLAVRAKAACRPLANASTETRNAALLRIAALLEADAAPVLAANAIDLENAVNSGISGALLDRLKLDDKRLAGIAKACREVAALPDPVGEVTERWTRPNGLALSRVRIPLGSILIIYEARPNVTVDAAALCIKSGNAVLLRGGKEALHTNRALARLVARALADTGLPADACTFVDRTDRDLMLALLKLDDLVDLAIPRGGEGLIRFVAEHARVPVIKHYKGVCHVYVDAAANAAMAADIVVNGKVSRPGVCNATECLLVHESQLATAFPAIARRLAAAGVELRADARALPFATAAVAASGAGRAVPAQPSDFGTEFLDLVLAVKTVSSLDDALDHIARYGSLHSESIVTDDEPSARRFLREVEASYVAWNASTRFNDGGELGLGAEMGISTTKLHAFGPMGLRELTATKFVAEGSGQVR